MKNIKGILIIILISGGVWFFYPSGHKAYLQKHTLYLLKMARPMPQTSDLMILRRVQQMAGHIHFDVSLKAEVLHHHLEARSLNRLKSLLMSYFKSPPPGFSFQNPAPQDMHISLSQKNNTQAGEADLGAEVRFPLALKKDTKQMTCQVRSKWIKQKNWQVKKIHVSECKENPL